MPCGDTHADDCTDTDNSAYADNSTDTDSCTDTHADSSAYTNGCTDANSHSVLIGKQLNGAYANQETVGNSRYVSICLRFGQHGNQHGSYTEPGTGCDAHGDS